MKLTCQNGITKQSSNKNSKVHLQLMKYRWSFKKFSTFKLDLDKKKKFII